MEPQPPTARQIFERALEIKLPAEREAYLAQACAGLPDLKNTVAALLLAHEKSGTFLETPATDFSASAYHPVHEGPGTIIGPYKLLQQLGEGGMGTVFMAEQTRPVQRRVALKIIKLGMDTRQVIARFEAERQALALMDHPNIARVLDAGTTDTGRPYFVMELVKGVPITRYCDEQHLSPRQRLLLFVDVCRAVQHAHQKGIIHRDLKPSNVLIAEYDEKPVPKVIDFGVAKAVGQPLTEKTMFTALGQVIGTIEYMSPEHARLNQLDIDTRSDVYSLGVILYELLTGGTPFDRKRLQSAAFDEMLRIIREEEPATPSTRLSASQLLPSIAANRHLEPKKLTTLVRGELDWIVMKSLEKDRQRRYETVAGLARDIERYINDEPVEACPPSAWYRFRKFARKHKVALAAASALVLAVLLTVAGLVVNNRLVTREKNQKETALARALQEKQRADQNLVQARKAVNQYLRLAAGNPLLKEADFHELRRTMLEAAIPFYEQFVAQQTDVTALEVERAEAYADLALVREELGELDKALGAYDQQRVIFQRLVAQQSEPAHRHGLAISHRNLANVQQALGKHDSAEAAYRQAMAVMEALVAEFPRFAPYRGELTGQYSNLSVLFRGLGRLDEALPLQEKATALREQLVVETKSSAEYREGLAQSLMNLCALYMNLGRHEDALKASRRAGELCRVLSEEQPRSALYREMWGSNLDNQSVVLCDLGRREDGLAALQQALRINEKLAADFPSVPGYRYGWATSLMNLSILQTEMGRLDDGLATCDRAIGILEALASEAPNVAAYQQMLAVTYHSQGQLQRRLNRLEQALGTSRKALSIQEKLVASNPTVPQFRQDLALTHNAMGEILCQLGRYDESGAAYNKALPIREELMRTTPSVVAYAINLAATYASMGTLQLAQQRPQAAIEWYDKALSKLAPALASEPKSAVPQRHASLIYSNRATALGDLARHSEALKDLDKALALDDVEDRVVLRLQRAATMAHLQMHVQAAAEAEAVVGELPNLPAQSYQQAASVLATCSAAAREDASLSQKYAARAVALLRQAAQKDKQTVAAALPDEAFNVLRTRSDFQQLVKEIDGGRAAPASSPAP